MSRRIGKLIALSVFLLASLTLGRPAISGAAADETSSSACVPLSSTGSHGLAPNGATTAAGTGGSATVQDYATPQGTTLSSITLPSGFNPAQASDATLSSFHLPPRPTDPGALSNWMQNYGHSFFETVPASPPCSTNRYAGTRIAWAGRSATSPTKSFNDVTGHWTQPNFAFFCLRTSTRAIWDGLSGPKGLIQAGSYTSGSGINDVAPFVEVAPLQSIQQVPSPAISTGNSVNVETTYSSASNGTATWWFQNFTTGKSQGWTESGVSTYYDGTNGVYVDERETLPNGTISLLRNSTNITYWSGEYINGVQANSWATENMTMQDVDVLMTAVMGATITSSETWKDCGPGSGTKQ